MRPVRILEVARTLRGRCGERCPMLAAVTAYSRGADRRRAEPYDAKALLEVLATLR